MKRTTLLSFALIAMSGLSSATVITYTFNTGTNLVSGPNFPAGGASTGSDSTGHSLGVTVLNLASTVGGSIAGATLTGSSTLDCVSSSAGTTCASTATSEDSTNNGHASGLGVSNGRIDAGETLIIQVLGGFSAKLVGFQTTALVGNATPANQETGFYNIGAGNVNFLGSNNAVDVVTLGSSLSFTTLTFGAPTGGPNGGNTYALQSLTLDITPTGAVPEPGSMALLGSGLVALGMLVRRQKKQNS